MKTRSVSKDEYRKIIGSTGNSKMDHDDPIAFFITIATYGTWLPGDQRGWVEYQRGWQLPDPIRELEASAKMQEDACMLAPDQRLIVELQLEETCQHRGWKLHAKNCRSNHLHALIGSYEVPPKKVRADIKAWCTRRLKEKSNPLRENWWADRGSIRWVFDDEGVDTVSIYINEAQDSKHLDDR
jgi:REP element-mobilizing transposase RayT